jgi:GTP-binding protein Era
MTRVGFVALAGRPNAGKSTLVNQIVGHKVAIVSDKPQTTRREIRGIVTGPDWQLVLVDLPGVQRPRDPMTQRMQRRVERALADADAVLFVVNGAERIGAGDRFIADAIKSVGLPAVTVVNKVDRLDQTATVTALTAAAELGVEGDVFPISAKKGHGVGPLVDHVRGLLPEGPMLYPREDRSDLPEHVRIAELVREQVLRRTRQEIPHAVEVEVVDVFERDDGLVSITANVWTEGDSQKAILIGAGGSMVKAIGTAARKQIEKALGRRVHLELQVRVKRGWRGDDALLDRLGIE